MPDPDTSPAAGAAKRQEEYPIGTLTATASLRAVLRERIIRDGPMAFPDFMAAALYDPSLGYYARGTGQVGRGGDFFTSVSVGPLFGELLARRFLRHWREIGRPPRWRVIECGAHDGTLARDVLDAIRRLEPTAFSALEYAIPEPLPLLRAAQAETLAAFGETILFIADPAVLSADRLPGIAFGNEVLDALPFHVVEKQDGRWMECFVGHSELRGFEWELREICGSELLENLAALGTGHADGYRTEIRTNLRQFMSPLVDAMVSGLMIWADYGFAKNDYYHPGRTTGTLRTFSKHRADENPLAHPGEVDITAHVDFTAVAEAAMLLGGRPVEFANQGKWLTESAREWLMEMEGTTNPQLIRQFQTLTHPAQLGGSFHFLEISWDPATRPRDPAAVENKLFAS